MRLLLLSSLLLLCSVLNAQSTLLIRSGQKAIVQNDRFIKGNYTNYKTFWVRPLGGSYGTGDGTSYDNAWSGLINIEQDSLTGGGVKLNLCGAFENDSLVLTKSGTSLSKKIIICGGDSAVIDGNSTITTLITINNQKYIDVQNLELAYPLVDGANTLGNSTYIRYINIDSHHSGNQAYQNDDNAVVTYIRSIGRNCGDDGMSTHGNSVIHCIDCSFIDNSQGMNSIATGTVTLERCSLANNSSGSVVSTADSKYNIIDCYIEGSIVTSSTKESYYKGCYILNTYISVGSTGTGGMVLDRCFIMNPQTTQVRQLLTIKNCYAECYVTRAINTTTGTVGQINIYNSVFKSVGDIYAVSCSTAVANKVQNCTFVGIDNVGRGVFTTQTVLVQNCIFFDLKNGVVATGATAVITDDYNNKYDVTTPWFVSTGGMVTRTNEITGDPKLTDVANNNYQLQAGSVGIAAGTDLSATFTDGIWSATWQNKPIVDVCKRTLWDLGAYVYH